MSAARPVPRPTREAQARASDPRLSAWVSANAGSGKTHVLAQRVIRLLLAEVPPGKILCLTFTKAAAANMAARVFDELARWTRLDDAALARTIEAMTGERPGHRALLLARRLFARTIETPGGLKIQTIHAFCERLLHTFPFEANVAAQFEVIEDVRKAEFVGEARTAVLAAAQSGRRLDLGAALQILTDETSSATFEKLIDAMHYKKADCDMIMPLLDNSFKNNLHVSDPTWQYIELSSLLVQIKYSIVYARSPILAALRKLVIDPASMHDK